MDWSRQGMLVGASSRPSRERCWQGMPVKASSRTNLVDRSRQGMPVKASSSPNLVDRSLPGMPVKASSRPS